MLRTRLAFVLTWVLAAGALAAGAPSCGGDSFTLSASTTSIAADGVTVVELHAEGTFRGSPIADGKDIRFSAGVPVLFEDLEDTVADVEGGRPSGQVEVELDTSGGRATAYLLAPLTGGAIDVEASHTNVNGDVHNASVTIEVGPPPLVSAASNVGGVGAPTAHFGVRCQSFNVGAFFDNHPEILVPCTLTAEDHAGRSLPHTSVQWFVEAGEMADTPATEHEPRTVAYRVRAGSLDVPEDVEPFAAEIDAGLADFDADSRSRNPRDGLVTILAVARGHEAFLDDNDNGVWDEGEYWEDEGEPFLDVDDDGVFAGLSDAGKDVACCDANGNGMVDGPNGQFDGDTLIGRMTHILWSGPLLRGPGRTELTAAGGDTEPLVELDGGIVLTLRIVDASFNPVARLSPSDEIDLHLDTSRIDYDGGEPQLPFTDVLGVRLRTALPDFKWGRTGDRVFVDLDGALGVRTWTLELADTRTTASSRAQCWPWTLTATVGYTPGDGSDFHRLEEEVVLQGMLDDDGTGACP